MAVEVLLEKTSLKMPSLTRHDRTVSELSIALLSEEWPLSAKGILARIRRLHAREVTFQAVYKALKKLQAESILDRQGGYYLISMEWLERVERFCVGIRGRYRANTTMLKDLP